MKVVEASRRHGRWSWRKVNSVAAGPTRMSDVLVTAPSEAELEEDGARRLLAAVDELNERGSHLKRRREQLTASLPELSQKRADTYRLNSDALTLGRTGATYQDPQKMAQLGEAEVTADDALRGAQLEIRQLDKEIGEIRRSSDGAFGWDVRRGARHPRADQ
jgi:DNA repair exonuclease SbcCD ATPase subunit